jgi:hypothetical protein
MGEAADDVRRDVERARARLGQDLNALEYTVRSELDWRYQFDRHPWAFLGTAFGVAALVGMAVSGRPRECPPARP